MRIAIIGAGAIGGWLAVKLARSGNTVSVLARGATLAAIQRKGLRLIVGTETLSAPVIASDVPADLGPQDLVVIAVKGPALPAVAPAVAALLGPETSVLSAMNGVPWWFLSGLSGPLQDQQLDSIDPQGSLSAVIPPSRVIGCVVHSACSVAEPGCIVNKSGNGLIVGEPHGGTSERLTRVSSTLQAASFDVTVSSKIQQDIWYKLWGNMTMNPISALTGATSDRILDDTLIKGFTLRIMAEAAALGERIGCPIRESGEDRLKVTRKLGSFKTSMLQDVEAGRPLELDALVAAPREIARRLSLQTPNLDALHGLARVFAAERGQPVTSSSA